jgi:transcriptional regulator with XRE-family HTH domain
MKLKYATSLILKQICVEAGLSQEQLARKSGIDRTYISGVERLVRNITLDSLEGPIYALGVTSDESINRLHIELLKNKS